MNKEALQKSIVLNGPVGSGKSLLARELSHTLGYPIISTDFFRNLPSKTFLDNLAHLRPDAKKAELTKLRDFFFHSKDIDLAEVEERLKNARSLLPYVRNYSQMGFSGKISKFCNDNYGQIAWHFYHKQFENILLQEIIENITTPVILDLGGGVGISLDRDYQKLKKDVSIEHQQEFSSHFRLDQIGFDKTKILLSNFSNIVYLKLPTDFSNMTKAYENKLNNIFISTHQYEETASQIINVETMIEKDSPNWSVVRENTNAIISNCINIDFPSNLLKQQSK